MADGQQFETRVADDSFAPVDRVSVVLPQRQTWPSLNITDACPQPITCNNRFAFRDVYSCALARNGRSGRRQLAAGRGAYGGKGLLIE